MSLEQSPKRLPWEEYALELAKSASSRSQDPYQRVGACALNFQNRVLGVGYNGLAAGKDVESSFWEDRDSRRKFMIHAETNCLSLFRNGECGLLAVTLLPCSSCATLIASYGIPKVVYSKEYDRDSGAKEVFNFYGIKLVQIHS